MRVPAQRTSGESDGPLRGLYPAAALGTLPLFDQDQAWVGQSEPNGGGRGDTILPIESIVVGQVPQPGRILRSGLNGVEYQDVSLTLALERVLETGKSGQADGQPDVRPSALSDPARLGAFVARSDLWLVTGPAAVPENPVRLRSVGLNAYGHLMGQRRLAARQEPAAYARFARLVGLIPVGSALRPVVSGKDPGTAAQLPPEGDGPRFVYRLRAGRTLVTLVSPLLNADPSQTP